MKEPKDTKARRESEAKMKEHFEAGGTSEEWNKMYDITPDYVRSFPMKNIKNKPGNKR